MKIRNEDLGKLNELKLDLLSPPYSFRLNKIAEGYLSETISLVNKYVNGNNEIIKRLDELKTAVNLASDRLTITGLCKEAALIITRFTRAD